MREEPPKPYSAEPQPREFTVSSGIRLATDQLGDPKALPVVFLHGGGQTRHAWAGTAEAVAAAGFLAISVDHRGHGDSSWSPDGLYKTEDFADDLLGLIDQLGRAPIVVGASLGGITAMIAHSKRADALAGLVLVDVTPRMEVSGVKRVVGFMSARPEGFASLEDAADAVASYLPHRTRPKDLSGLKKNLRLGEDGRYRWHWDPALMKLWNPARFDLAHAETLNVERLKQVRLLSVPTLLIRGRMSDVVSEEGAQEFLSVVKHAEYVDLAAAGHMVAGDRNDVFTTSVTEFLRRRFN